MTTIFKETNLFMQIAKHYKFIHFELNLTVIGIKECIVQRLYQNAERTL